jgi:CheY-like chemotaxis protein
MEDEKSTRSVYARVLERSGYDVIECEEAHSAWLEAVERGAEVDVVMLDVIVPVPKGRDDLIHETSEGAYTGVTAYRGLRTLCPTADSVMLTNQTRLDVLARLEGTDHPLVLEKMNNTPMAVAEQLEEMSAHQGATAAPQADLLRRPEEWFGESRRPEWFPAIRERADLILSLEEDWDSYGAPPIQPAIVEKALRVLAAVTTPEVRCPSLVPTRRGGVQIEWHTSTADMEIEFIAADEAEFELETAEGTSEWVGKLDKEGIQTIRVVVQGNFR